MNFLKIFLRFLYPPKCVICGKIIQEYDALCENCWSNVKQIVRPFCNKCSSPIEFDISEDSICGACMKEEPKYIKARSAFIYNKAISNVITRFKFFDETYLKRFMALNMVRASQDILDNIDILIPVPLHKKRLRQRKYNQSLLLCEEISKLTKKSFISDFLYKKKHTKQQSSLRKRERLLNLRGKFAVSEKYLGQYADKNIAIVDDVMTTGTTINECIKAMNKNKIKNIYVITFAKTKQF
ncbi:MAG: ComF family protein [Rickettsiales bacterium]|jgi:ComF family protein|nr:ComF family protein [Rickettsiales bacterium]